ncbi:MAG: DUF5615 family PIN-like protein [Phormidesmis sp.]
MALFYTDEQFPLPVVEHLRELGHDVLTVQEAGKAGHGIPDDEVLAFAVTQQRAVLTLNRHDFVKLHRASAVHFGVIACTNDRNWALFAERIHQAVAEEQSLEGRLIRVTRLAK